MPRIAAKKAKRPAKKVARKVAKKAARRTFRQMFIDALREFAGAGIPMVANANLQADLGWDRDRYQRIKEQLSSEGMIITGRGPGGMVGLAAGPGATAMKVFISYSHMDESLKDNLIKHLSPLKRAGLISDWHDRKINAGGAWAKAISDNLEAADLVLLLVSVDFINSAYCYDIELERALELEAEGRLAVIPVILRNCMWHQTPFAKLQALPRDGKAVSSWPDEDDALTNVAEGIRKVVNERLNLE